MVNDTQEKTDNKSGYGYFIFFGLLLLIPGIPLLLALITFIYNKFFKKK